MKRSLAKGIGGIALVALALGATFGLQAHKDAYAASTPAMHKSNIIVDGQHFSKQYKFVYNGTTYMSIWYIMQALKKTRLQVDWNGSDVINYLHNGLMEFNSLNGKPLYNSNGQFVYQPISEMKHTTLGFPKLNIFESQGFVNNSKNIATKTDVSQNTSKPHFKLLSGSHPSWLIGIQLQAVDVPTDFRLVHLTANIVIGGADVEYQSSFDSAYKNGTLVKFPKGKWVNSEPEIFMADSSGRRISFGFDHAHEGARVTITAVYQGPHRRKIVLRSGKIVVE